MNIYRLSEPKLYGWHLCKVLDLPANSIAIREKPLGFFSSFSSPYGGIKWLCTNY